ncbi:MAG TPA: hypothetical protein VKZ18_19205 [Polyangia bacterium]|nr:hypothetical protein [Polyangia bacterium]
MLAIAVLAAAAPHAARAQEVTPEAPAEAASPEAPPPNTAAPPAEAAPAETGPPPAEAAPAPAAPAPPPAPAAAEPTFGAEGQLLVSVDLPFMNEGPQLAILYQTSTMNLPSSTRIVVQPSVDYFVAPNLSLGAQLGVDHLSINYPPPPANADPVNASNGGTTLSVEARIGYAIPIADTVSIWPRLGVGYTHTSTTFNFGPASTGYAVPLSLTVPFLWHPGRHFFVGGGPAFVTQLANSTEGMSAPRTTDYGITALIGGAIGGK